MREVPINKVLPEFHRSLARIRKLLRRVRFELLISGSQVRALVRPPPLQFSRLAKRLFRQTGWFCSLLAALLGAGNKLLPGLFAYVWQASKTRQRFSTDVFDFREVAREGSVTRFVAAGDVKDSADIHEAPAAQRRQQGRGSVHHVAFRVADDAKQRKWPTS